MGRSDWAGLRQESGRALFRLRSGLQPRWIEPSWVWLRFSPAYSTNPVVTVKRNYPFIKRSGRLHLLSLHSLPVVHLGSLWTPLLTRFSGSDPSSLLHCPSFSGFLPLHVLTRRLFSFPLGWCPPTLSSPEAYGVSKSSRRLSLMISGPRLPFSPWLVSVSARATKLLACSWY